MSGDENEVLYTEHFGNKRVKGIFMLKSDKLEKGGGNASTPPPL